MIRLTAIAAWLAYSVGLHWIFVSLHRYAEMPAWIAAPATLLLSAYVSLYLVAAVALCRWLGLRRDSHLMPPVAAAVITLAEWLRGTLLTGFPWLSVGYLAIDTPLAGFAQLLGVYGVGFALTLCLLWVIQVLTLRYKTAFAGIITVLAAGLLLDAHVATTPEGRPLRVALVQGAIEQSMKFDPDREKDAIVQQIALARTAAVPGGPRLIVMPETALVRPWELVAPDIQQALYRLVIPSDATLMLGLPMRDPDGYRNSLIALRSDTPAGSFAGRYDKHHLVPFGEFIPWGFRWFVNLMNMPLGDFQKGGPVQAPISVEDQRIGVNICFEDLFGEEIIRPLHPDLHVSRQPTILLNISNLAWFGDTIALGQHLDIARMRTRETGRPMIRATNTGATAAIDHRGRVTDLLPYGQAGLLVTQVQGMSGTTPFIRWGNLPILILSLCLLTLGIVVRHRGTAGSVG
jgi:apolipoprotein N-acyltransferase